jgi:hypothetical protein
VPAIETFEDFDKVLRGLIAVPVSPPRKPPRKRTTRRRKRRT